MNPKLDTYRDLNKGDLQRRRVDVWLPSAYHANPQRAFPVLYMHDGQMVFDNPRNPDGGWMVHQALERLAEDEKIDPPIVVAIPSTIERTYEYLPAKAMAYPEGKAAWQKMKSKLPSDENLEKSQKLMAWIVETVKPFIDSHYRTLSDPANSAIMGSSLGALAALTIFCEYPQVFHKAACLSSHWPILGGGMISYLADNLPSPEGRKLYFDYGSEGLDSDYAPWQAKVDALVKEKAYEEGKEFVSWSFPGEGHNTKAWAARLHIPLTFLFGTIDL